MIFRRRKKRGKMTTAAPAEGEFSAWLHRSLPPTKLEESQIELRRSERRLEAVRTSVVHPIEKSGNRNQFSNMLRELFEGR